MKIAIITYFHDGLVGFMDFSYRIEALSNIADVDLFCRYTVQDREEFRNSRINEIVVKPKFSGLESGGAKVGHGSGGIIQLRAE